MLTWILLAMAVVGTVILLRQRGHARGRLQRRGVRRARRKAYAQLWDQVMVRPRTKRLVMALRIDPADGDPSPGQ